MPSTRKIIRAFLASPGDLQEERKAIRDVVVEWNESWANELGYQVELIGWEETVSRFGRPQNLINQEVDRCDLFVGMMWKKWGTSPDCGGAFSSGFQEEFERSMARRERSGIPEISLFFKEIPSDFMTDPGDDLKKVIEFQKTIIADKKILFQKFSTTHDIETLVRKCVTAYVNRVRAEDESSDPDELRAKRARSASRDVGEGEKRSKPSLFSAEGLQFLDKLVKVVGQPRPLDALSPGDVARFRLLANSISKAGNEEMHLGVHDINILFAARTEGMVLGEREVRCLARLGFQHLVNENVPLWCWYSALADSRFNPAVISSFAVSNENEKVGAITVLTALALDLATKDDAISRDMVIDSWFSDVSSPRVRIAALRYLAKCGTAGDLEIAKKEYDRNDHGTSRSALECILSILLRTGRAKEAQKLTLESQFETLNADLLVSVLQGLKGVETPELLIGLEHRNSQIRLCAVKVLHGRGDLDVGMAERLTGDSDALVRREAVGALMKLGKLFSEEEVKKILVLPRKQSMVGLLSFGSVAESDSAGEEAFEQYQLDVLKELSEGDLEKRVGASLMYDDTAYFALGERYFKNHADELRRNVDDKFSAYFEERIRRMEDEFGDNSSFQDLVKKARDLKEVFCKQLTRQGLNVLCKVQKLEDLQRVRANLREGYVRASKLDAKYLGRHGEWIDIPLLANVKEPSLGVTPLTMSDDEGFQVEVARAITSIGKKRSISDLLSLEMPATILKKTIELCPEPRFAKISRDVLLALFNHESEGVRKAAVVLAVRALSAKRTKSILREYLDSGKSRYYNIIHWLDLGVSMSRENARKVARAVNS